MSAPAILVEHLTQRFDAVPTLWRRSRPRRDVLALDDCSLTVEAGTVCALLGCNGAGKTTLLKILATLVDPTGGAAAVGGHDVVRDAHRVRRLIGWMTGEGRSFYWRLSGLENLRFFAALRGLFGAQAAERIGEAGGLLQLGDVLERPVATYSTGQRQRLAVARALLGRPQVLLCDEPTQSLDLPAAQALRRFLREEMSRKRGCAVLYATHQLDDVRDGADRVLVLNRGRLTADTTPALLDPVSHLGLAAPIGVAT